MPLLVKYVLEHPSGRCDYRRVYPPTLQPFIKGSPQFKRSLGFRNEPGFLARYEIVAAEFDANAARARKMAAGSFDPLDQPTIAYLAEAYRVEALEVDEASRWDMEERSLYASVAASLQAAGVAYKSPWAGREGRRWAEKARENLEAELPELRRMRAEGDVEAVEQYWRDEAVELAEARGLVLDANDRDGILRLCRALNGAAIDAALARLQRLEGHDVPTPPEPALPPKEPTKATQSSVPLLSTYDAYATSVGISPRGRVEGRSYLSKLVTHLGHDDAARITSKDVGAWRDKLLAEPTRTGGARSPVTVNDKYLAALKALLGWASKKGRELLPENVAEGIRADTPKKAKTREKYFTKEEALRVLKATLDPAPARMSRGHRMARRWIPWLCAYSGARVGEIAQLRAEDVKEVNGVWVLSITPEAGTVKTQEYRLVPIHEHVIDQGFLQFVRSVKAGPLFYDPEDRRGGDETNRHISKVGERLAKWVRNEVGITDAAIKPNHAWRHLWKSTALDLEVIPRVSDAITGHASPGNEVGRTYEGPFLKTLADAVGRFPRFDVEPGNEV